MTETYPKARARLFSELRALGWIVVTAKLGRDLKVPHATSPRGDRLDFYPQSVHRNPSGHSLHIDIRGMTVADLVREAET